MTNEKAVAKSPVNVLKEVMASQSVQEQFRNALADKKDQFTASLIDLYAGDQYLQKCAPQLVVMEALKAAVLNLPISKSLGFAWVIPYNKSKKVGNDWVPESIPQFQLGWRGVVQLAQRTGKYRYINCGEVFEGEYKGADRLSGMVDISGVATSENIIGFFAYIELLNGFCKTLYWSKEKMEAHAIRYNQECKKAKALKGVWADHFVERAKATILKHLIAKYGPMSIDMAHAMDRAADDDNGDEDYRENANKIDIDITPVVPAITINTDTGEVTQAETPGPTSAEVDAMLAEEEGAPY